jgi:hypothetical protein
MDRNLQAIAIAIAQHLEDEQLPGATLHVRLTTFLIMYNSVEIYHHVNVNAEFHL